MIPELALRGLGFARTAWGLASGVKLAVVGLALAVPLVVQLRSCEHRLIELGGERVRSAVARQIAEDNAEVAAAAATRRDSARAIAADARAKQRAAETGRLEAEARWKARLEALAPKEGWQCPTPEEWLRLGSCPSPL